MHPLEHRCSALLSCLHQALAEVGCDTAWLDKNLPSLPIAKNNLDPQKLLGHFSPNEGWSSFKGIQDPGAMGSWPKTAVYDLLFHGSVLVQCHSYGPFPIHTQSNNKQRFWLARYYLVTMSGFSNDGRKHWKLVKMSSCHGRMTEVAGLGHIILYGSQSQHFLTCIDEPFRRKTFVFKVELIAVVKDQATEGSCALCRSG